MNKDYWLSTATGQIPFPPDRDAVRRELAAHLEDRQEAIQARGMTAYEAEQAATAAVGDPEPLARELAQRIENELEYPGQIKVHVLRETKVVEYAK